MNLSLVVKKISSKEGALIQKKKKLIIAVETNDTRGIKRIYFDQLEDYSYKEIRKIFDKHISKSATIKTDKWTGYNPLKKELDLKQIKSDKGKSLKELHTIIHQVKSWLRNTFSWVHKEHIQKYLDEFSYRINRSIYKEKIFDLLINRMMNTQKVLYQYIIVNKCTPQKTLMVVIFDRKSYRELENYYEKRFSILFLFRFTTQKHYH